MISDPDLEALAGGNPDAAALLEAAYEQTSGADLERVLLAHASPAVFTVGLAECLFLAMQLEDRVEQWKVWHTDQAQFVYQYGADWNADQVNAELLVPLFRLLNGRQPCHGCVQDQEPDRVTRFGAEGACGLHGPARQVRHELLQRTLGGVA